MNPVDRIARHQYGLITAEQARASGLSKSQIHYRVSSGRWVRVRRGVFRLPSHQFLWEAQLLAATLGRTALASHRAASALWGLEIFQHPRPEIVTPHGNRTRHEGAILHRTTTWHLAQRTVRRGVPCTGIERTILDCAAITTPSITERLAEAAIRQRLTTWPQIADLHRRVRACGRDGTAVSAELLDRRLGSPTVTRSDFSNQVRELLMAAGLPAPVVEHCVHDANDQHVLALDLAWPSLRKGWELDSRAFHFDVASFERDRRKRNIVAAQGWSLQLVTWEMFSSTPDQVVAMARTFLAS